MSVRLFPLPVLCSCLLSLSLCGVLPAVGCSGASDIDAVTLELLKTADAHMKTKSYAEAAEAYLKAAEAGNARAQDVVGTLYAIGRGVERDMAKAETWWKRAAEQKNAVAAFNLYRLYGESNPNEALAWLTKSAEWGDITAQMTLSVHYYRGEGVERSLEKCVQWMRRAAEQGDPTAQINLAECLERGEGCPVNFEEAAAWYRKAADQGNAEAQNFVGVYYSRGTGLPKDDAEAFGWFLKSAEQGYVDAQWNLAACYADGRGTAKNSAEKLRWLEKAAARKHPRAQEALGTCLLIGEETKQDLGRAYSLLSAAADHGSATAQTKMGMLCEKLNNPAEAKNWYRQAAAQGEPTAQVALKRLK